MNQILVTEKLYVTPQIKRKKFIYKIEFFLSVFLVCILFSYYIYAEYDRNKSEQVSQEILEQIKSEEDPTIKKASDGDAIVVILDKSYEEKSQEEEQNNQNEESNSATQNNNESKNTTKIDTATYKTKSGTEYTTVAILKIPTINLEYPVLSKTTDELLNISVCYFWGKNGPNEVGNYCIAGHYYRSGKLFGNLNKLKNGDIAELTDLTGRTLKYEVYHREIVKPTDTSCTSQLTDGRKELTLITCTQGGKERLIVKLREVK